MPTHPLCERGFGIFLLVWGVILELDVFDAFGQQQSGVFYGRFQSTMPGWAWGAIMIGIAAGRWIAYETGSNRWRLRFSAATVALLAGIAAIAIVARLPAVGPTTTYLAVIAWWCHGQLSRALGAEIGGDQ